MDVACGGGDASSLIGTGVSAEVEAAAAAAGGGAAEDERRDASLFIAPSTRETANPALCFGISPAEGGSSDGLERRGEGDGEVG